MAHPPSWMVLALLSAFMAGACDSTAGPAGTDSWYPLDDAGVAADAPPVPDAGAPDVRVSPHAITVALSAPAMTGRKSGTPGGTRAATYIANRFAACGLQPFGDSATRYLHTFKVSPVVHTGTMELAVDPGAPTAHAFTYRKQWRPARTSPGATLTGDLFFAGYGLDDAQHDDFKGVDVTGKVVLVLSGCPSTVSTGCEDVPKITRAHKAKARALILITDNDSQVDMWGGVQGTNLLPIPAAVIKGAPGEKLLPPGQTVAALQAKLEGGPQSFDVKRTVRMVLARKVLPNADAYNVLGVIRAQPPSSEYVVAGAHYDHLGYDEPPASYFPGALDNASGTAVVVDAACRSAARGAPRKRNLVFAAWGAEEDGLIGSRRWLDSALIDASSITTSFNLDMVGGKGGGAVNLAMSSATVFQSALQQIVTDLGVPASLTSITHGASDHANFVSRGIPTVYLYGPFPPDMTYHTTGDTVSQLSASALDQLGRLLDRMTWEYASNR